MPALNIAMGSPQAAQLQVRTLTEMLGGVLMGGIGRGDEGDDQEGVDDGGW